MAELFHRADPSAAFAVELWDGENLSIGSQPSVTIRLSSEKAFGHIVTKGFTGFGEAFVSGDVQVEGNLQELLRLGIAAQLDKVDLPLREKFRLLPAHVKSRNTRKQAHRNIAYHYDRGNDFYALYLDSTMTYSCAYFKGNNDSLEQAQVNKYDHIARKLMLGPDETLLDVGCGWGGMLIHAALKYTVRGLGNTISQRQYEYADQKINELGLHNRIQVVFKDYRDLSGKFDKFVSIGMFEHVGKNSIPKFMRTISRLLKKGGLGLLHTIGRDTATTGSSWINQYIFPGGYIPELSEIIHQMGEAGFCILDIENLRMHYARTLDLWAENFERNAESVREMSGETFMRTWRLFLHASAAAFKYGDNRLYQILFSNGLNNDVPITREHLYKV